MRGVYKITFGNKFYIGRANCLASRMYQHQTAINGVMKIYASMINLKGADGCYADKWFSYRKFAKYLQENPKIKYGVVEVLQRCSGIKDLYETEYAILRSVRGNPDCLNRSYIASKQNFDYEVGWEFKKVGNVFYYYDPAEPNKLFPHVYNISAIGEISKPRR